MDEATGKRYSVNEDTGEIDGSISEEEAEEMEIEEEEEKEIHVDEDSGKRYNLNNTTGVSHWLDKR